MFEKVLIANRGEIAVRVVSACRELGIESVAVYSDADENAKHVRLADEAYNVGPSVARKSYLDVDAILEAAEQAGVDAIHPGYGFLAENAAFARRVEESEFVWVGPSGDVIEMLGEKTRARQIMEEAGVPIVPGTTDPAESADEVVAFGEENGWPVAVKAAGGGGGKGMRVAHGAADAAEQFDAARREGEEFFDNPDVYLERYLENPRHVEVQVIADEQGNVRHLGERDCSLQRRYQKLVEETPSPVLSSELRDRMTDAAVRGAAAVGYVNAGTVEFLVESAAPGTQRADGEAVEDDAFYFLEVNTRIQVEHTVTEAVTGIDLVKWQLRVAAGEELFAQDAVEPRGAAIEFRINAEDPSMEFAPMPGELTTYRPPRGIGVRVDDGIDEGDRISPFYDSMMAKVIVHGEDRTEAIARGKRALREMTIEGVPSTIPFHRQMLSDETFVRGEHTTKYVDDEVTVE